MLTVWRDASLAATSNGSFAASFGGEEIAVALLLVLVTASAVAGWSALYGP